MSDVVKRYHDAASQLTQQGAPFELSQKSIDGVNFRSYSNAPRNMRELLAPGRAHGDAAFLQYEGETWSFTDFFAKVDGLTAALNDHYHIEKGQRVAIAMRNYPEWMVAYAAIACSGAIAVPLNSWWHANELQYALEDCDASLVFCDEQRAGTITADIPIIVARATTDNDAFTRIEQLYSHSLNAETQCDLDENDAAMIMYTSGTTGKPKGALSTQDAVCHAVMNFECSGMYSAMANPHYIEYMMGAGVAPVALLAVPLFHVSGCYPVFLMNLRAGRKIVMMYKWDAGQALRLLAKHGVTIFSGAPSMLLDLFRHPDFEKTDTSHLSGVGAGGSAMSPTQVQGLFDKLDNPFPGAGYGMTETNGNGTTINGDALKLHPNSAGQATPIVDIKVCDSSGKTLATGERGEVWIKSLSNASSYWNKAQATIETFKEGWVLSGDVGYLDEDGFLFIVDRIKDMVIRGGENIYCVEIEAVLAEIDGISEGVAIGVAHETLGEELALVIRLETNNALTAEHILTHFKERVAAFKVPRFVKFIDTELPRNATGKVLKKQLSEELTFS